MPLNVIDNLVYTPIRLFTDNEWETLPSQQITVASSRKSNDLDFVMTDATVSTNNITEVRSDLDHNATNLHIDNTFHDQTTNIFVKYLQKAVSDATKATRIQIDHADPTDSCNGESIHSKDRVKAMPEFQPSDLIGHTFLVDA